MPICMRLRACFFGIYIYYRNTISLEKWSPTNIAATTQHRILLAQSNVWQYA